jgi:hypothetical protein
MIKKINYLVKPNSFGIGEAGRSIGTEGCGPCVGLIVIASDKKRLCAHISCQLMVNAKKETELYRAQALEVRVLTLMFLKQFFPDGGIIAAAMCSGSPGIESKIIMAVIGEKYSNISFFPTDGIVCGKDDEIIKINHNINLKASADGIEITNEDAVIKNSVSAKVLEPIDRAQFIF